MTVTTVVTAVGSALVELITYTVAVQPAVAYLLQDGEEASWHIVCPTPKGKAL